MPEYIKMKLYGGNSYIQPKAELANAINGELDCLTIGESVTIVFTPVEMTETDYEKLSEFMGH